MGAFAKRGITITPEEIAKVRGASKREVVRRFAAERSKAKGTELDELIAEIYADFNARTIEAYRAVPPIEGAEAAFQKLRAQGILLTASTGFGREIAASIFQRLGWEKYFANVVTGDDVSEGRPAPYMIFRAMEAAKVTNVAEVMVVGDTPLDLQAGTNAGARGWSACCLALRNANGSNRSRIRTSLRAWRGCRSSFLRSTRPGGSIENLSGPRVSVIPALDNRLAVHDHVFHAGRVLMRLFVGGVVDDRARVEDGHIGRHAGPQQTRDRTGGSSAALAEVILRIASSIVMHFLLAHVAAQHTRGNVPK